MEVCEKQIVDFLFWGWRHGAASVQHYSDTKNIFLLRPVDLQQIVLIETVKNDKGTHDVNKGLLSKEKLS